MKNLFCLCLFVGFLCAAPLQEVKFKGLSQLSNESAFGITGLKIGEEIDGEKVNQAILRLYEQGYFNDIFVEQNGGVLEFTLKQRRSIARINITGVASNDTKQINEVLNIKQGNLYDEGVVKEAAERIRMYYEVRGYFDTVVETSTKDLNNTTSLQLDFEVNRGENIIIQNVNLIGSQKLSYSNVEPFIANKEKEFMGWMWGRNDGALKVFELSNDSARINDEYMKRGYLDAKISSPALQSDMQTYTADLSYFIKEGVRYKITSISIENPVFDSEANEKKVKKLKSKVGKIANIEKIRADIESIQTDTANLGYAFARVYPDVQKDEENGEAKLLFRVVPNEKVYIRDVIITGNSRTNDRVVRRELYLTEGELYHKSDLRESVFALRRSSYFDEANIKEERVDETQVDLLVEVKEASTGSISGGIGYGSTDGLLLNASLSDTNIFGTGLRSVVSVDCAGCLFSKNSGYYSSYNTYLSGRIGLTNPRLFDSHYSLGGSVYASDYSWVSTSYNNRIRGFDITLGRAFARYFSAGFTYNLESSELYGISDYLRFIGYKEGKSIKSSISPFISFNNTDDYYLPRSGFIISTSLEIAGAGGDQQFIASSSNFNFYQGLKDFIGWDLIFRYKAKFYKLWDTGYLPVNQRVFLGGIGSLRGYGSRSVSPKYFANRSGYEYGGTMAFSNSVELSFPIIDRVKLRGALFFDYGFITDESNKETLNSEKNIQRYSTGIAFEWITPMGPLQFVFAKPLIKKPNDDIENFEFTMGTRF